MEIDSSSSLSKVDVEEDQVKVKATSSKVSQVEGNENKPASSSSSIEKMDTVSEDEEITVFDKVFCIDLIWRKLSPFLYYGDLKALRLVNKQFNTSVLNNTRFINKSLFVLTPDLIIPPLFKSTTIKWKHFKVFYTDYDEETNVEDQYHCEGVSILNPFLKQAQSLDICVKSNDESLDYALPFLYDLLGAPDNLKELHLDANVLQGDSTKSDLEILNDGDPDPDSSTYRAVKNLNNLEIFSVSHTHKIERSDREKAKEEGCFDIYDENEFDKCFSLLRPHIKNLKVLKLGHFTDAWAHENLGEVENNDDFNEFNGKLMELVKQNRNTLVELHVKDIYMWSVSSDPKILSILKMDFPQLKVLTMRSYFGPFVHAPKPLIAFLNRHAPNLESLDATGVPYFSNDVMDVIRTKCKKLKKLHIKTTAGFTWMQKGQWDFMKNLDTLEDFSIRFIQSIKVYGRGTGNIETHHVLFSCLPRSIRKLCIKINLPSMGGGVLREKDFQRINPEIFTHFTYNGICRTVDDTTMEFICRNFKRLQHLELMVSADNVTDYGFTGLKDGEKTSSSDFSIKDLKGLQYLAIASEKLTRKTYINALQLPGLKYLKIGFQFPKENYKDLVNNIIPAIFKNNPSLEVFATPELHVNKALLAAFPSFTKMVKWNPRLKEHVAKWDSPDTDESDHDPEEEEYELDRGPYFESEEDSDY